MRALVQRAVIVQRDRRGDADQREVAVAPRDLVERVAGRALAARGISISVSSSPGSSAVEKSPVKNSRAGNAARSPPVLGSVERRVERQHHRRQLRRRIGVRQAAADRAAGADRRMRDVRHRLGDQRRRRARPRRCARRARCRVMPPIRRPLCRRRDVARARSAPFRSTSTDGVASRKFIAGIRLCPPASGFASLPCSASSASASSSVAGRKYSNGAASLRQPLPAAASQLVFERLERLLHHHLADRLEQPLADRGDLAADLHVRGVGHHRDRPPAARRARSSPCPS